MLIVVEMDMNLDKEHKEIPEHRIMEEIIAAVRAVKYGEVVITVYNSKVVQLEKKEKKRFK